MKVIGFERNYCKKIARLLDSYLNNELLVETIHEVLKHIRGCPDCSEALSASERVRAILQTAVRREAAPLALREKIKRSIRWASK
jgi:anti-sigma factor (TIGR02949 family)